MMLGSEEIVEHLEAPADPDKLAVYPLAIPYLFNPASITVLIIASDNVHSVAATALLLGLVCAWASRASPVSHWL
jgi:multiple antibiotic resistance protein